jgi:hypothetical protein
MYYDAGDLKLILALLYYLIIFKALIRRVQVVIEQASVGAAFSRDHLISRLKAAPTTNTTCSFQKTTIFYIESNEADHKK